MAAFGRYRYAVCRRPGPDLAAGVTTADLGVPDHGRALKQFDLYVALLRFLDVEVTVLDPLPGFPDAHFVEDTAVITPEFAVIASPGHRSRDGEQFAMAETLGELMPLERIGPEGFLDGGDVLQVGSHFLIGLSDRTDEAAACRLGRFVEQQGFTWASVPVDAGLHFKSSVNALDEKTLLVTADFADRPELADFEKVIVPEGEEYAANSLPVNGVVLVPRGFPKTEELISERGLTTLRVETSEFRKMDGGLTCLSIRW